MKKSRIIAPALGVLVLSTAASITGTVAWFTANNSVTVSGMQFKTAVGSNLQISGAATPTLDTYRNSLSQPKSALILPSSSVNGIGFYYTSTSNVDGSGNAIAENYTAYNEQNDLTDSASGKNKCDNAFNQNYGIQTPAAGLDNVAYAYLDYDFYLRGQNTDSNPADIKLTQLSIKYNGKVVNDNAWRVALIAHSATEGAAYGTAWAAADVVSIFKFQSATNFDNTPKAIGSTGLEALSYGNAVADYNQNGTVATLNAGASGCYKVTVRLWLEGEDTSCTNATYASLTGNYSLDLKFELGTTQAVESKLESWGTIAVNQAKEDGAAKEVTTVDGESQSLTLNPYKTSNGQIVYCADATATAESVFYSVNESAATTLGTQASLR